MLTTNELIELLIEALPLVEDALDDETLKASGKAQVKKLAAKIRKVIEDDECTQPTT